MSEEAIRKLESGYYRCPNCGEPAEWFNLGEKGEHYCANGHTPKVFGQWARREELIRWLRSQDARAAESKESRDSNGSG